MVCYRCSDEWFGYSAKPACGKPGKILFLSMFFVCMLFKWADFHTKISTLWMSGLCHWIFGHGYMIWKETVTARCKKGRNASFQNFRYFKYNNFASHQITVTLLCILRWGRYLYDRRTEKILQCNEKVGIQETSKTHSKTLGKLNSSLGKCSGKMQFNSPKSEYIYVLHINYSYCLYIDTHTML